MDIVEESNGSTVGDTLLEEVESSVGLSGGVVLPVKRVDISIDDVVSQSLHDGEGVGVVAEVRGTHVRGPLSNDLEELSLQTSHLGSDIGVADGSKVGMAVTVEVLALYELSHSILSAMMKHIRVRAELVTLGDDTLDGGSVVVDVGPVLAVHEEGGLVAVLLELVEKLVGVGERTIVESEGDVPVDSALGDGDADRDSGSGKLQQAGAGSEDRETHFCWKEVLYKSVRETTVLKLE